MDEMPEAERLGLSSSFGTEAKAYSEHRPDYSRSAVAFILERAPGMRVLDVGAGTGKLTTTLFEMGCEVVAVEPDRAMLAQLRDILPAVRTLPGHAEEIPLPDSSVDAVVSGNAMHWFAMDAAESEIARVLSPNGVLAGLWNIFDDRVDWVEGLVNASGSEAIGPRDTFTSWDRGVAFEHLPDFGSLTHFGPPQHIDFVHGQQRTADSLVATLSTKAGMLIMPEQDRQAVLSRIRGYLALRPETSTGEFMLPMLTSVILLEPAPSMETTI